MTTLDRRSFCSGIAAAYVAPACSNPPADADISDFLPQPDGSRALSERAIQWSELVAKDWGCTPQQFRQMMIDAVLKGSWPYLPDSVGKS